MNSDMPKKMIIPCIIEVLKNYTDENNTFTQEEIGRKLESNYGMKINRKTLSRNLKSVMIYDDRIRCSILKRNGEELSEEEDDEGAVYTDFYFEHIFEKSELQALIYNVIFAKHISSGHKKDMVKKLESLGSFSIRHDMKHYIREDKESSKEFGQLFWNLNQLDGAIASGKIVEFQCASYEADMKLHVGDRIWKVFPFGIAEKNNDYYLVGLVCGSRHESTEELLRDIQKLIDDAERGSRFLHTFRIDQIRNLVITENEELREDEKILAQKMSLQIFNKEWGTIQDYVRQNNSLSSGRNITAKFKMVNGWNGNISDAIDYFGKDNIRIETIEEKMKDMPKTDGYMKEPMDDIYTSYIFTVKTNDQAMMEFAKIYAQEVEVMEPDYLREDILNLFKLAYEKMSKIKTF